MVDLPKRNYQLGEIRIYQLKVRQLTDRPVRTLSVKCNDPVRIIWGIAVIPKCTSSGSYIDLKTGHGYDSNDYPIIVSAGGRPARFNNNIFEWKSKFVNSKSSQVELTFSVELER